jgi:hypothetical protein
MSGHRFGRLFLGAGLLALVSYSAYAQGNMSSEPTAELWENAIPGQIVELSGKVRRVGNVPFTALVITDSSGKDWHLDDAGTLLLKSYEQKEVLVKGKVFLKEMILANGKKLPSRRTLTEITIVEPDPAQPGG